MISNRVEFGVSNLTQDLDEIQIAWVHMIIKPSSNYHYDLALTFPTSRLLITRALLSCEEISPLVMWRADEWKSKLHHRSGVSWIGLVYLYRRCAWWWHLTTCCRRQQTRSLISQNVRLAIGNAEAIKKFFVCHISPWWWSTVNWDRHRRPVWCPKAHPENCVSTSLRIRDITDSSLRIAHYTLSPINSELAHRNFINSSQRVQTLKLISIRVEIHFLSLHNFDCFSVLGKIRVFPSQRNFVSINRFE